MRHVVPFAVLVPFLSACASSGSRSTDAGPTATVITGSGDIQAVVEQYRALLGPDNGGAPASHAAGRREINWDKVPDEKAAPQFLPGDFFNAAAAPRARGAVLSTPGEGLQVSAASANAAKTPTGFGHINASYSKAFPPFSKERLFSPIGSNVVDLEFRVPGTSKRAVVRGFGAVYADVDTTHTAFEYFDVDGRSLGRFAVPIADNGLSFLGVAFSEPCVAKVRIEYGTVALGPDDSRENDVAVMDDFIFGEPHALPAECE